MNRPFQACFLAFGVFAAVPATAATDWPQFRGPRGDGISDAKDVPLHWSRTENVRWMREIPGRGWSSPVLKDGKIYLTTAVITDGKEEADPRADRSLRALCLDLVTGGTDWEVEVFKQEGATAPATIHQKNGHASPTPIVTADGHLLVHFGHQGSACLDLTGKKLWENRSLTYPPRHGNGASPVLVDGRIVFNCDAETDPFIAALDVQTGAVAWRRPRPETAQKQKFGFATCGVFSIDGQTQVISPGPGAVDALDPASGKPLWRVTYEGYSNVPNPIFAHGLIYITSSYDTPDMYAIDPHGASGDVTETHVKWTTGKKAPMTVSPIVIGDEIYWVTDQGGFVTCANAKTGEIHWAERIGARANSASPVSADGRLYLLDEEGKTHVLKPGPAFVKLAENDLGEKALASPTPLDGGLLIRTETKLWRVGK